jgi:ribose 5-phosphate isomerase B
MSKKIAIGNDHAGTKLKQQIVAMLEGAGYVLNNYGTNTEESVDYPDYVHPVANSINMEQTELGILICGSAQGVSMTANKYKNIRAAVCWTEEIASLARQHNNANVLCLPARFLTQADAETIVNTFLKTEFAGGRHQNRINKICLPLNN